MRARIWDGPAWSAIPLFRIVHQRCYGRAARCWQYSHHNPKERSNNLNFGNFENFFVLHKCYGVIVVVAVVVVPCVSASSSSSCTSGEIPHSPDTSKKRTNQNNSYHEDDTTGRLTQEGDHFGGGSCWVLLLLLLERVVALWIVTPGHGSNPIHQDVNVTQLTIGRASTHECCQYLTIVNETKPKIRWIECLVCHPSNQSMNL
mmetsp:Transcript_18674/g.31917  ORF Transcript_18674/g.31917 Transcript_18674/m.31917 type:complete len:203 (-) Transcript_18674:60-668(-)